MILTSSYSVVSTFDANTVMRGYLVPGEYILSVQER